MGKKQKREDYKRKQKKFLEKQTQLTEKERKKEIIKKVLNVSIPIIVIFLCATFILSGGVRLAMVEHDQKSIRICYSLYILLEIIMVHSFILMPNYRDRYGGELPKSFVHSIIIISLSSGIVMMTRFFVNDLNIEILAVALNVCILDYAFYRFENKNISKIERKHQRVSIGIIIFRIFKICIEILIAFLLIDYLYKQKLG